MDKRVLFLILLVIITGVAATLYTLTRDRCEPATISWSPGTPFEGNEVVFVADHENEGALQWMIDNAKEGEGESFQHTFTREGEYKVSVLFSETCRWDTVINIARKPEIKFVKPEIDIPTKIVAGKQVIITDKTPGASSWKWEITQIQAEGNLRSFAVTFAKPGAYRMSIKVDGDAITGTDTLTLLVEKPKVVISKPPVVRERVVKPPVVKREPAVKPTPPARKDPPPPSNSIYDNDQTFSLNFVRLANAIASDNEGEQEAASDEWPEKITRNTGPAGSLRVVILDSNGAVTDEISLESFKSFQLTAPWEVKSVAQIDRRKDGSILKIRIRVLK